MTNTNWLGVVSADHVRHAVSLGIAQIGHGKRSGLDRMRPGDTLIYYSPRERMDDTAALKEFTAFGTVAEGEVYRADEGTFQPFRRRVEYLAELHPVPAADLVGRLDLTSGPNWGYQLRRGLIPLSDNDVAVIRAAMTVAP